LRVWRSCLFTSCQPLIWDKIVQPICICSQSSHQHSHAWSGLKL